MSVKVLFGRRGPIFGPVLDGSGPAGEAVAARTTRHVGPGSVVATISRKQLRGSDVTSCKDTHVSIAIQYYNEYLYYYYYYHFHCSAQTNILQNTRFYFAEMLFQHSIIYDLSIDDSDYVFVNINRDVLHKMTIKTTTDR